jgi:glycosyltransferase involved in cell wall biosynthesis
VTIQSLMRCPSLAELPPPPPGKTGWPWTVESERLPDCTPDGLPWPRASLVTPSYNQGGFIEETIRSVLLQGYPDLEYIIVDGGSSDASVEIIQKYARWIAHWESGPDRGQADAINKGLGLATGDAFHFINSDDLLARNALAIVAPGLLDHDVVAGGVATFTDDCEKPYYTPVCHTLTTAALLNVSRHAPSCTYHQPGVWLRRRNVAELGGFDISYRYCFDAHLFIQHSELWPKTFYTTETLAHFRTHGASKSFAEIDRFGPELVRLRRELSNKLRSPRMRRFSKLCASRFVWRIDMEGFMHNKHGRSFSRFANLAMSSLFRPNVAWDVEGRRLFRSAFDQALAAAVRAFRLPQESAEGPESQP